MLPRELKGSVVAPPGFMLVERLEMPERRGLIWLPGGWRSTTRSSEAVIVSVGSGVEQFEEGEHVLLATSVGRSIEFGFGEVETLWKIHPMQAMCRIEADHDAKIVNHGTNPAHGIPRIEESDWEQAVDEGDSRGLQ